MGYDNFWSIFEETGDIEDYLEYVNHGEYYTNHDKMLLKDERELEIALYIE